MKHGVTPPAWTIQGVPGELGGVFLPGCDWVEATRELRQAFVGTRTGPSAQRSTLIP